MNLESIKIDLAKQLSNIDKSSVLEKIKAILGKEEFVAYITDGKSLLSDGYFSAFRNVLEAIEKGIYLTNSEF